MYEGCVSPQVERATAVVWYVDYVRVFGREGRGEGTPHACEYSSASTSPVRDNTTRSKTALALHQAALTTCALGKKKSQVAIQGSDVEARHTTSMATSSVRATSPIAR